MHTCNISKRVGPEAAIAQLGERQTEDLKVPGSIPGLGIIADYAPWLALNQSPYEHVRS